MTRYPLAPLAALLQLSEHKTCEHLGITGAAQKYRTEGMSYRVADRMATRAGFHPGEVWPEWWHDDDEEQHRCDHCRSPFEPRRKDSRFCSERCYRRWWARELRRRRYHRDPDFAEKKRQARRAYYAQCGEYERQRERAKYAARFPACSPVAAQGPSSKVGD